MSGRVLVTGGAGFIGSELVGQLVEQGREVVVIDNLVNGKRENLAGLPPGRVRFVAGDIRDRTLVSEALAGVDSVFHLACLGVRHSIHSPAENHDVNATATLGLLAEARSRRVSRFVYVSSSEVYGTGRRVPMDEDHPTFPMTVYGASKLAGESYTRAYHRTYGLATVVVRPFNTFGPRCHHEGDSGEVIPKFMLRALARRPLVIFGDGQQTRDFTEVSDTARGILACEEGELVVGETLNIGAGREITIRSLADAVATSAGWPTPSVVQEAPRPGDVLRLYADVTKARRLLGFEPQIGLNQGLARLRRWYEAQDQSPESLLEAERVRNWEDPHHA